MLNYPESDLKEIFNLYKKSLEKPLSIFFLDRNVGPEMQLAYFSSYQFVDYVKSKILNALMDNITIEVSTNGDINVKFNDINDLFKDDDEVKRVLDALPDVDDDSGFDIDKTNFIRILNKAVQKTIAIVEAHSFEFELSHAKLGITVEKNPDGSFRLNLNDTKSSDVKEHFKKLAIIEQPSFGLNTIASIASPEQLYDSSGAIKAPGMALMLDYHDEEDSPLHDVFIIDNPRDLENLIAELDSFQEGRHIDILYQPSQQAHFSFIRLEKATSENRIILIDSMGEGDYTFALMRMAGNRLGEEAKSRTRVYANDVTRQADRVNCSIFAVRDAKNSQKIDDFVQHLREKNLLQSETQAYGVTVTDFGLPIQFMPMIQNYQTNRQVQDKYQSYYNAATIPKKTRILNLYDYTHKARTMGHVVSPSTNEKGEVLNRSSSYFKAKYNQHFAEIFAKKHPDEIKEIVERYSFKNNREYIESLKKREGSKSTRMP